jgi:hypothetical protein
MDKFNLYEANFNTIRDELISSWQRAFCREITEDVFIWLFSENSSNRIFIARSQATERIAGVYCLLPQETIVYGNKIKTLLCNNVFTDPDFRTYNIFVKLGRFALEVVKSDAELAIGIPNEKALPGHKRVGWNMCQQILFSEIKLSNTQYININNRIGENRNIELKDLESISNLWMEVNKNSNFAIVKDKKYLKWRYFDRPKISREYYRKIIYNNEDIRGYLIISHYYPINKMHIIDICAKSEEDFLKLINLSIELAIKCKAECVNIWNSPAISLLLSKVGFTVTNEFSRLIIKPLTISENKNQFFIQNIANHALVLGDNDVF